MKMEEYIWDYRNPYEWMRRTAEQSFSPMIITCALTGGVHGKEVNENLPETAEEQADAVYEAYKEGAASVHIHARKPENQALVSSDPADYSRINRLIRERCPEIIINNTTGGGLELTREQRMCCLFADPPPDMASLNLGPPMVKIKLKDRKQPLPNPRSGCLLDIAVPISYEECNLYAKTMKEKGIKPELELYHPGHYWVIQDLIKEGNLAPPYIIQFVMGFQTGLYPTPANILSLINELPPKSLFCIIGVGPYQLPMNVMGIIMGGHVRVGLEDNVFYRKGERAQSGAQQVARIKRIAEEMNRNVATVAQAREMLGLPEKPN